MPIMEAKEAAGFDELAEVGAEIGRAKLGWNAAHQAVAVAALRGRRSRSYVRHLANAWDESRDLARDRLRDAD